VEVTVDEAFHGTRRSLTITGPDGPRTIDVDIPAGVVDGQRIRLRGQGGAGTGGADPGDLYLVARIAPDRRYRLEGRNLHVTLPLAPWEAALGTEVDVETPAGKLKVTVPAGTSSGRRLRLAGQGLPRRGGEPGDLFAEAQIMVPEKLTSEERRLFQKLAKASTFDPRSSR
jgi:curved DNA-binding protein